MSESGSKNPNAIESSSEGNPVESIVQSIVPYQRDDERARYLGYRCCGFTIREALKLVGRAQSTLSLWRKDAKFVELENNIPTYRRQLGVEYANLEFLRNFRLVLEKDYRVLQKSLDKTTVLTGDEQEYLLKLRSQYTPQQLQMIETLVIAELAGKDFNFTDFIITASRTDQKLTMERKSS